MALITFGRIVYLLTSELRCSEKYEWKSKKKSLSLFRNFSEGLLDFLIQNSKSWLKYRAKNYGLFSDFRLIRIFMDFYSGRSRADEPKTVWIQVKNQSFMFGSVEFSWFFFSSIFNVNQRESFFKIFHGKKRTIEHSGKTNRIQTISNLKLKKNKGVIMTEVIN